MLIRNSAITMTMLKSLSIYRLEKVLKMGHSTLAECGRSKNRTSLQRSLINLVMGFSIEGSICMEQCLSVRGRDIT